ncbi:MAG: aminotransferase class V-fold PLP-dependent enzyme [Clostridia bacterium]|nr:aminotransferase class V-fold PLP-dependent enzyme [Clostridia bacterium]
MNTPIIDFVNEYVHSGKMRLHMPGHKGVSLLGYENYDITEIDGADVLYDAKGIIRESMENASMLFGTEKTLYSTEGSSLSIRAMLYLAVLYAEKIGRKPVIFAGRNAHKVFVTSSALLDFDIKWIYGEKSWGITECIISPECVDSYLSKAEEKPVAVYLTSPDYLGNIADVKGISKICRKHGVLLLVDNAHGAYLNFLPKNTHPIHMGADICCDSAHKTLPALTGAGYLHISKNAPELILQNAEKAMTLFASTSPSYLIMQSLDAVNKYLSDGYRQRLSDFCNKVFELKKRLSSCGIANRDLEDLKITLTPKKFGYTGIELYKYLSDNSIVCEFYDPDCVVMMLSPENSDQCLEKIYDVLTALEIREEIYELPPEIPVCDSAMSVREACFSESEILPVEKCISRVFAGINFACPPAIPLVVCGEIITEKTAELMKYYGVSVCEVVKQ